MGKKSSSTTTRTVYGNTTTTNPYVTSSTTNKGTTSSFNKGNALDTVNNFMNQNMGTLLENYLNPTLNSVTNQAKLRAFNDTLNATTLANMENNIINPLSKRNMIRSSQATDLYKNLLRNNAEQTSAYANDLLSKSQKETATMLANLMLMYMNGYNVLSDTQRQSLATSQGNATKSSNTTNSSGFDISPIMQMATQAALLAAGL